MEEFADTPEEQPETPVPADDSDSAPTELAAPTLPITAGWADATIDSGVLNLDTPTLALEVSHAVPDGVALEVTFTGDLGTTKTFTGTIATLTLGPGVTQELEIDLSELFPTLAVEHYSGCLQLAVAARNEEGQVIADTTPAPIYFHSAGGNAVVYGDEVLRNEFSGGDFQGLLEPDEADEATTRVLMYVEPDEVSDLQIAEPSLPASTRNGTKLGATADPAAGGFPQELCVEFEVDPWDAGFRTSSGVAEDHWWDTGQMDVIAHGVRVDIKGYGTFDTDPDTGCVDFDATAAEVTVDVRVYAAALDNNNNLIRVHSGPENTVDPYPGKTYSALVQAVTFRTSQTRTLAVGDYTPRWTGAAAFAFSLWRYADGISDTEFHVGEVPCGTINANYQNFIPEKRSYIQVSNGPSSTCSGPGIQGKFLVAHEYGHAYLAQNAGNPGVFPFDDDHMVSPSLCLFAGNTAKYNNATKEWSSTAIREGGAHFIAARVWNDNDTDGQMRWNGGLDIDLYDDLDTPGGHLVNDCCSGSSASCAASLDGAGTLLDWARAFWDMHTDSGCALNRAGIADLYADTVNASGLTLGGFFPASQQAVLPIGSCEVTRWDDISCHNGIDREGQLWTGC